jgi:hypothetical protein
MFTQQYTMKYSCMLTPIALLCYEFSHTATSHLQAPCIPTAAAATTAY